MIKAAPPLLDVVFQNVKICPYIISQKYEEIKVFYSFYKKGYPEPTLYFYPFVFPSLSNTAESDQTVTLGGGFAFITTVS